LVTTVAWRITLKKRIRAVACLLALWGVAIEARLVYLQVFRHADLVARAERQQKRSIDAPGKRGDILDRRGRVLATSVDADSIYAVPSEIGNPDEAAAKLCQALGDCAGKEKQALVERLSQTRAFAYVRRQVSPDQARRVAGLNLDGVGFIKESKRFYPNKELAAHLLGWVGIDNNGLSGIEFSHDPQIRGKKGTILIHTDARRHAFSRFERPPTTGSTVELTIDEYLQHVAERELHAGVLENQAAGGSAIILNPRTGEILAMANEPTFNPNAYRESQETDRRNRAVQDLYEPGSTFKVVTASAAIEEKVMSVDAPVDVSAGQIHIGPRVVHDMHTYGVLSFTDVIVKSSNVGAIKIGFRVGAERLSRYVARFGFGHPVSPDFPGESPGIVWAVNKWTDSALASVSMGYQVGVTPLQMVTAVSSVANGGELVEPRIIRAVDHDAHHYSVQAKVARRAITPETAATLTTIMEQVVERGTAKPAQIPGYTIAGKTGTAHKLVGGHYSPSEYNASFVGFLPSRNPAVAIIVVIDSPHGRGYTGGIVSGPIFKRIAETTLRYLGIAPTVNPDPPVLVARHTDRPAEDLTALDGVEEPVAGPVADPAVEQPIFERVSSPLPSAGHEAPGLSGSAADLGAATGEGPDVPGTIPDLRGLSARDALRRLVKLGLNVRVSGDGSVVAQDPAPGTVLEPGSTCRLLLERVTLAGQPAGHPAGRTAHASEQ
jgi:cell division protein FtsI/penicillin-binding protein 2